MIIIVSSKTIKHEQSFKYFAGPQRPKKYDPYTRSNRFVFFTNVSLFTKLEDFQMLRAKLSLWDLRCCAGRVRQSTRHSRGLNPSGMKWCEAFIPCKPNPSLKMEKGV